MDRLKKTFDRLAEKGEKALVGFVSAGDPDMETSLEIIRNMCEAGLDILELGVPFSDPTADGPVIQRSSARALEKGITLETVLEMTRRIREYSDIPIILFSYYNPVFAFGARQFYTFALEKGADGVLIVDLPPEESDEMTGVWEGNELSLIRLIAPTTPVERMKTISDSASGFLYMVSKTGVTGSDGLDTSAIESYVKTLRSVTHLPICVGFGISTPEDVRAISKMADGIVIGSAFERLIENHLEDDDLPELLGKQTRLFKNATRKGYV
ncbi:MAG: tryptophan synthase subunit alpha [Proteobacteria bacterium]|nr:tryptophan synthase subunit alpha [Pseudomonadota bacterium]